jgi:hypothetical protein
MAVSETYVPGSSCSAIVSKSPPQIARPASPNAIEQ